jgi:hypothetical protein
LTIGFAAIRVAQLQVISLAQAGNQYIDSQRIGGYLDAMPKS